MMFPKKHQYTYTVFFFFAKANNIYKSNKYDKADRKANTNSKCNFLKSYCNFCVSLIEPQCNYKTCCKETVWQLKGKKTEALQMIKINRFAFCICGHSGGEKKNILSKHHSQLFGKFPGKFWKPPSTPTQPSLFFVDNINRWPLLKLVCFAAITAFHVLFQPSYILWCFKSMPEITRKASKLTGKVIDEDCSVLGSFHLLQQL